LPTSFRGQPDSSGAAMADLQARFDQVVAQVSGAPPNPKVTNQDKLNMYKYFKQQAAGDVTGSQPWAVQVEARAKWDAWNSVKGMSKEAAQEAYIAEFEAQSAKYKNGDAAAAADEAAPEAAAAAEARRHTQPDAGTVERLRAQLEQQEGEGDKSPAAAVAEARRHTQPDEGTVERLREALEQQQRQGEEEVTAAPPVFQGGSPARAAGAAPASPVVAVAAAAAPASPVAAAAEASPPVVAVAQGASISSAQPVVVVQGASISSAQPIVVQGASVSAAQPIVVQGGSITASPVIVQGASVSSAAAAPVVLQGASVSSAQPVIVVQGTGTPGASISVPQFHYPAGSVEVPVYRNQVNVQRVVQRQLVAGQVITTVMPQQATYAGAFTQQQLKTIFPMGAPQAFTPAPSAPLPTLAEQSSPAAVAAEASAAKADGSIAQTASKKKGSKKKFASKKKTKGCC